jgi:hypothetical protein
LRAPGRSSGPTSRAVAIWHRCVPSAGADRLEHLHDLGLLRVHRHLGRYARLRVPWPQDCEPDRGPHRERDPRPR